MSKRLYASSNFFWAQKSYKIPTVAGDVEYRRWEKCAFFDKCNRVTRKQYNGPYYYGSPIETWSNRVTNTITKWVTFGNNLPIWWHDAHRTRYNCQLHLVDAVFTRWTSGSSGALSARNWRRSRGTNWRRYRVVGTDSAVQRWVTNKWWDVTGWMKFDSC